MAAVDPPVGNHQDVVAASDRIDRIGAQRCKAGLDAFLAPFDRVADVELIALKFAVGIAADMADAVHVFGRQDRLADFEAQGRVDVVDVEQIRLGSDEGDQRHHQLLADRVDRRVGDLCKQLFEIVVEGLVLVGQDSQRRVVAHRAGGFFAVAGHRRHQEADVLLGVAEGLLAIEDRDLLDRAGSVGGRFVAAGHCSDVAGGDFFELDADTLDPLAIGLARRQLVLEFGVVDDATLLEVDQEHLARLQAPLFGDARIGDLGQHARLGGHHHQIVIGDDVARRTQTVAIEGGADLATVGEGHGGRAVPGLHHGGVILVEGAPVGVHRGVLLPGLGDHHHHGLGERITRHHQQLEAVVETGGIGLAGIDQRQHFLEVAAEHRRAHHAFARAHPVVVALDGVDLTVVREHAVGMGEFPGREGVGREALMHQSQRGDDTRILQVEEVFADLVGQQQTFVDDGSGRHRRHEVFLAVLEPEVLDRVAGGLADDIELALEGVGDHDVATAADEDLADDRLGLAYQRAHLHGRIDRYVAPAEDALAFGAHGALEFLLAGQP